MSQVINSEKEKLEVEEEEEEEDITDSESDDEYDEEFDEQCLISEEPNLKVSLDSALPKVIPVIEKEVVYKTVPTKKKGAPGIFSSDEHLLADFRHKSSSPKKVRKPTKEKSEKKRHILARKSETSKPKIASSTTATNKEVTNNNNNNKEKKDESLDKKIGKVPNAKKKMKEKITSKKSQWISSIPSLSSGALKERPIRKLKHLKSLSFSEFTYNPFESRNDDVIIKKEWYEVTKQMYKDPKYQDLIVNHFRNYPSQFQSGQLLVSLIDNSDFTPRYTTSGKLLKRAKFPTRSKSSEQLLNLTSSRVIRRGDPISLQKQPSPFFNANIIKSKQPHAKYQPAKPSKRNTALPNAIIFKLQPILEGYLTFKRKRRWVILDDSNLYIFKSVEDYKAPKIISLHCSAVRKQVKENLVAFEIITAGQNFLFFPDKDAANRTIDLWIEKIQEVCEKIVMISIVGQPSMLSEEEEKSNQSLTAEQKELKLIAAMEGNSICADCKSKDPEWASINLGVFICIECSGIHRSFGTHISKVRSTRLDKWEQSWVDEMRKIGNIKANETWEYSIPPLFERITESSNLMERKKWLNLKYVEGRFRKDWEERQAEKKRMLQNQSLNGSFDLREAFLTLLREDSSFRDEVRKILLSTDPNNSNSPVCEEKENQLADIPNPPVQP